VRHAAKRDAVEPAIVTALELAGWTVVKVSDKGFPDLCCFRKGEARFLEVKSPGGTLTPAQKTTFARMQGALVTVHVVRTPEQALMAVGAPVDGVLGPLTIRKAWDAVAKLPTTLDGLIPVHPKSIAGVAIQRLVEERGYIDAVIHEDTREPFSTGLAVTVPREVSEEMYGHLVTPAYQKAQTAAVVPPKRGTTVKRRG
jgi:hypothetical protein